mgnify:FL=1|jgi:hypothetical protein
MENRNYFLIHGVTISYLFSLIILGNKRIDSIFAQVLIKKNK